MTPLYNGNDYYKKMLDLQERLRKSEEERIRLEERFSLLEHESRSRHETCINRLRMRYIDFLEEQKARDERNHQLLGALDRVDSSLALMSAKTDRLGTLRKQYEASILAPYENIRPNGSVTGDSGVASQNDERHRRSNELFRPNGNEYLPSNRVSTRVVHQGNANRTNNSPIQVRPGYSYGNNNNTWSGIRCESSQVHQPTFVSSRFPQGIASLPSTRDNVGSSSFYVDKSPENLRSFLRIKNSSDPRESTLHSLRYDNKIPQNSTTYDYRNNDSSSYGKTEYPLRQNNDPTIPRASLKYDKSVIRDLANSQAYETIDTVSKFFNHSPEQLRDSNTYEQVSSMRNSERNDFDNFPRRNSILPSHQSSILDERKFPTTSSPRSPKLSEILRHELVDEDEQIGNIVENQLERYISKIRSLHHRDTESHSLDDIDHEQNTSGDLLNVTMSDDDGLELPIEEKSSRERLLTRELGNVLALANDLANQTATSAINVANNIYHDTPTGGDFRAENSVRHEGVKFVNERGTKNEATSGSDTVQQLASINRLLDEAKSHDDAKPSSYERLELLAKNGISDDIAKSRVELASRSDRNIHDIAKLDENGRDDEEVEEFVEGQIVANKRLDNERSGIFEKDNISTVSVVDKLEKSRYGIMTGVESENNENLQDMAEDLEPWNLSALERRVQEIILNDEAQDDFVGRTIGRDIDEKLTRPKSIEHDISGVNEDLQVSRVIDQKIDGCIVKNDDNDDDTGVNEVCRKNDEARTCEDSGEIGESANGTAMINEEDTRFEKREGECSIDGEELTDRLSREAKKVSHEEENIEETNYVVGNNVVDPSIEYGAKETEADCTSREKDSYVQGEYPEDTNLQYEQYKGDTNEQYERYSSEDNVQYDGGQGGEQYGYSEQQYVQDPNQQGYVEDPNQQEYVKNPNQQEYIQDPNQQEYVQKPVQQEYIDDPNQQEFVQDSNQQYPADPNQPYSADPNQQYTADPNQPYAVDPNQQYTADPNQQYPANSNQSYAVDSNQQYAADPNQQYADDPNQQYTADPDQQYTTDPNQQYITDPNQQYITDPNQQYPADPNQQYPADPNQQYPVDPNQQYPADPNQEYPGDPNLQYPAEPNQQYSPNSNLEYLADPGQQYPVDPNQQYPENAEYVKSDNHEYPAVVTDYPYPEVQEYPNNEDYVQGQEGSTVACEPDENLNQDPSKVINDDQSVDSELERTAISGSETKISSKEETKVRKTKDVIKSILDSDTESTIEKNVSNTESDFDFN